MRFAVLLPFLCAGLGLVRARDDRLLYTIPAGDSIDTFTSDFDDACATWAPAVNAGLTFVESLVEPGDFSGKNPDTEARIVCSFTNGTITTFTTDVAASLGATPA
ncbi:hypothetical protein B0H17DRAFT_1196747 [Mycena rosella]|uniref:Uncharacterized protein n=1 Tax=Mycena rosella TaxID=1033263 RepID=A0AAD7DSE7_MYCRO|nr:hypothetical protein B0H17DRAFT_1196747 [Mycena rosella]